MAARLVYTRPTVSRHRSLLSSIIKAGAAAARQQGVNARRQAVATARALRESEREARRKAVGDRRSYMQGRAGEAEALNAVLNQQLEDLNTVLAVGLAEAGRLELDSLKRLPDNKSFAPGKLAQPEPAPRPEAYQVAPLQGLHRILPSSRRAHEQATTLAMQRLQNDIQKHSGRESARNVALERARKAHDVAAEKSRRETLDWNLKIDGFAQDFDRGEPGGDR